MFKNVGNKIMILAKVLAWVYVIGGVIAGIVLAATVSEEFILFAPAGLVLVPFCWLIYGFGQLVQDVHSGRQNAPAPAPNKPEVVSDELPDL